LHWASAGGHESLCLLLLTKGADPTILNNKEETPAQLGKLDCIKSLLYDAVESKVVADSLTTNHTNTITNNSSAVAAPVKVLTQKPQPKKLKITLKK